MQKSKEWWKEHYDKYLLSKLSIAAYSKNNNIKKSTFYSWIKKFRNENVEGEVSHSKKKNSIEKTKEAAKVKWAAVESVALGNGIINENRELKITIGKAVIEINKDTSPRLLDLAVKVLIENA